MRKYYVEKCGENNDTLISKIERDGNFDWISDFKGLMYALCPYTKPIDDACSLKLMNIDADNQFIIVCNDRYILAVYRLYNWFSANGNPLDYINVSYDHESGYCSMSVVIDEDIYNEPAAVEKPKAESAQHIKLDMSGLKKTKAAPKPQAKKQLQNHQLDMFG